MYSIERNNLKLSNMEDKNNKDIENIINQSYNNIARNSHYAILLNNNYFHDFMIEFIDDLKFQLLQHSNSSKREEMPDEFVRYLADQQSKCYIKATEGFVAMNSYFMGFKQCEAIKNGKFNFDNLPDKFKSMDKYVNLDKQ